MTFDGRRVSPHRLLVYPIFLLAFLASSAGADQRLFVWNYEAQTLGRGEAELESYLTLSSTDRNHTAGRTSAQHQLELEIGMTDRFDFAVYEVFQQDPGMGLAYDGYKLRARYRTGKAGRIPFGSVAYLEFEGTPDLTGKAVEGKWILTRDLRRVRITLNPGLELEREEGEWELKPEYSLGAAWRAGTFLSLGAEAMGSEDGHYLGPVIAHGAEDLWVAVGPAVRLDEKGAGEPDLQVRLLLGLKVR